MCFSLGCIVMHLAAHEWPALLPETHYNPKLLERKVVLSEVEWREVYLNQIQELPEIKVLIEKCLRDDPKRHPDVIKMVNDLGKLRLSYQKNFNEMNTVEFEKHLKLKDKRISEQLLEIEKLNKTIQNTHQWI